MSTRQSGPFDSVARKWFALAQRRQAAFIEMRESGRWKHYYETRVAFDSRMREINLACDRWAKLVGNLPERIDAAFDRGSMPSELVEVEGLWSRLKQAKLDAAVLAEDPWTATLETPR